MKQDLIIEYRPSRAIKPTEPLPDNAAITKCPDGKAENSVQPRRVKPTSRSKEYGVSWRIW